MTRDNRALELQNTELRTQLQDVKTENLEVSEKIVLLDEEVGCLAVHGDGIRGENGGRRMGRGWGGE